MTSNLFLEKKTFLNISVQMTNDKSAIHSATEQTVQGLGSNLEMSGLVVQSLLHRLQQQLSVLLQQSQGLVSITFNHLGDGGRLTLRAQWRQRVQLCLY